MSTTDLPVTQDEYSSTVFDLSSNAASFTEESVLISSEELFSGALSRSVGDLHKLTQETKSYDHATRMSASQKDLQTMINEQAVKHVKIWVERSGSPSKPQLLQSNDRTTQESKPVRRVPLSPSCYRLFRKQNPAEAEELIQKQKCKSKVKKATRLVVPPLVQLAQKSDSSSRKNETSEEVSIIASATLDEYSNSVFIDDEDPTVGSMMSSEFDDYDNDENSTPRVNQISCPFSTPEKSPLLPRASSSKSPMRSPQRTTNESVTFNPLFNSTRAHTFIESRKQPWRVPQNEEITHENPLFRNPALHRKLLQEKIEWIAVDTPKIKRRFFRGQSLTELLPSRTRAM